MTSGSRLAAGAVAAAGILSAHVALAGETRFVGDDVRVTVDEAGVARIDHAIAYRVGSTSLRDFDLNGIEPEAVLDAAAPVLIDGETANAAHVERKSDTTLHVTLEPSPRTHVARSDKSDKTDKTRAFVVRVSYSVDLARAHEILLDGAMWRLAWTSPVAPEGYDGARVVFDVPATATEPRAIDSDGTVAADGRVITLRRGPQRDELEMERPHVARGEAASWLARIDPRAFPRVVDPSLRPAPVAAPPSSTADHARDFAWLMALAFGVLFGVVARAKSRVVARASAHAGVTAQGLVPLGPTPRAWLAGLCFGGAVAFELADQPVWGACLIVASMALAAHRVARAPIAPRGPGQWLALAPGEAFVRERASSLLDGTTSAGRGTLALTGAASVALGVLCSPLDPSWTWLAPIDAAAFLAILFTGCRSQLPPDRARAPVSRLGPLHRALRRDRTLRVAPWARVPLGLTTPDELRLLVLPRAAMPGVVGIEVGVAWTATPAGYAAETEVLVRVRDDSQAAARIAALAPGRRTTPGRKLDERVLRLVPSASGRAGTIALVRRLAGELRDRRKAAAEAAFEGTERRLPPNGRLTLSTLSGMTAGAAVPA